MTSQINFSIIIPNYNGETFLPTCLSSLADSIKLCPHSKFEVILSDNASNDSSLNLFQKFSQKYKNILDTKIIKLSQNLGFGAAINAGFSHAIYPYIVVANNDIKLDSKWFFTIRKVIKSFPDSACFYGIVLNKLGNLIESEGFDFHSFGRCQNINNGKNYLSQSKNKKSHRIWGAPASLIIYKSTIFLKLKGFDSRFFAYIEDVDLAYRLYHQGFITTYVPKAISYHLGGATSNKMGNLRAFMTLRNWLFFIKKNYTGKEIFLNFPAIFLERLKNLKYYLLSTPRQLWLSQIRTLYIDLLKFDHPI